MIHRDDRPCENALDAAALLLNHSLDLHVNASRYRHPKGLVIVVVNPDHRAQFEALYERLSGSS